MEKQKNVADILIVGGGASGLMAAIQAARVFQTCRRRFRITILDKNEKMGKKLLSTGNGRCNLTNRRQALQYYMTTKEDKTLLSQVLQRFSSEALITFFEEAGMKTMDKDGYIYPKSLQAQTVVQKLNELCIRQNIELETQAAVVDIQPTDSGYKVVTEDGRYFWGQVLILAMGSAAAFRGNYYGQQFTTRLGMKFIKTLPALCGVAADMQKVAGTKQGKSFFKDVSGVRWETRCQAVIDGKCQADELGELQLTDYGLSGIVIFCLSRYISRGLAQGQSAKVILDFFPDMEVSALHKYLSDTNPSEATVLSAMSGIMNQKLALGLIKVLSGKFYKLQPDVELGQLDTEVLKGFLTELKEFHVGIRDTNGFDKAQIATGGVALSEVTEQLEAHSAENLFLCGELLDVDGICGGYNLQWAWSSGFVAGQAAAKRILQ